MNKRTFIALVKRYLNGRASEQEKKFVESYDQLFDEVEASTVRKYKDKSVQDSYAAVVGRIEQRRMGQLRTYRIAAAIGLLLVFGLAGYRYGDALRDWLYPEQFHEYKVAYGKKGKITLADGTQVALNSGSTLSYSSRFNQKNREVFLDGEAYFEVTRNASKPFLVKTSHINVQVLGTSFNVRAFATDLADEVAVLTGKVAVQAQNNTNGKEQIILQPNEGLRYDPDGDKFEQVGTDAEMAVSWQHGLLHFKNTPLAAVARALERRYDVQITVDAALANCPVHAKVEGPLAPSLRALANALGASVSENNGQYHISGKGCI